MRLAHVELGFALSTIRETAALEMPTEGIVEGDCKMLVRYTPLGVAIGIVPWNYPVLLFCAKLVPLCSER